VLAGLSPAGLTSVAAQPIAGRAVPVTLTNAGQSLLVQADEIVLDRLASLLTACAASLT
jgi:hypothetical protein